MVQWTDSPSDQPTRFQNAHQRGQRFLPEPSSRWTPADWQKRRQHILARWRDAGRSEGHGIAVYHPQSKHDFPPEVRKAAYEFVDMVLK